MKHIRFFLGVVILFLSPIQVVLSQTISEIQINTGHKVFKNNILSPYIGFKLHQYNDSTFDLSTYIANVQNRIEERQHFLISHNLQVLDTISVWQKAGQYVPFNGSKEFGVFTDYTVNYKSNQSFRYYLNAINDSINEVAIYTLKSNQIEPDTLIFQHRLSKRQNIKRPYLHDTTVTILSTGGPAAIDTSYLETFSLKSGQLLAQRKMHGVNTVPLHLFQNPQRFFDSDSLFYIESGFDGTGQTAVFNKYQLNTVQRAGVGRKVDSTLAVDYNSFFSSWRFYVDSTGIEIGGNTVSAGDYQAAVLKTDWNDSLISLNTYGDDLVNESATDYLRTDSTDYLMGSVPRGSLLIRQFRQILLYRINPTAHDSLFLLGNKNDVAERMELSKNGDLFILSTYSNAWSDSSVYLRLTKIPKAILTTVREQHISRTIHIYPNPAQEVLNSDAFELGDLIRIYSINGMLLEERRLKQDGRVDVDGLKEGSYLLQIIKSSGQKTVLFIKQ